MAETIKIEIYRQKNAAEVTAAAPPVSMRESGSERTFVSSSAFFCLKISILIPSALVNPS